jgi:hypothetical protein
MVNANGVEQLLERNGPLWVLRKDRRSSTERHGFHKKIYEPGLATPRICSSHEKGEMSGGAMILGGQSQSGKGKDFRHHGGYACDPEWDGRYVAF